MHPDPFSLSSTPLTVQPTPKQNSTHKVSAARGKMHGDTESFNDLADLERLAPQTWLTARGIHHCDIKSVHVVHDGRFVYGIQVKWKILHVIAYTHMPMHSKAKKGCVGHPRASASECVRLQRMTGAMWDVPGALQRYRESREDGRRENRRGSPRQKTLDFTSLLRRP